MMSITLLADAPMSAWMPPFMDILELNASFCYRKSDDTNDCKVNAIWSLAWEQKTDAIFPIGHRVLMLCMRQLQHRLHSQQMKVCCCSRPAFA